MKRAKEKVVVLIISVIIISSIGSIFSGFIEKKTEEDLRTTIEENYSIYYPMLVDYTGKINKREEGVYEELNEKLGSSENILATGTYKNALSYYYLREGDYEKHKELALDAILDYKSIKEGLPLVLQTYSYMISNAISKNDYDLALKYCYEAVEIIDSEDSKYIADDLKEGFKVIIDCNFINIFIYNGLPEKAEKYYNEIKDYKKGDDIYEDNKKFLVFSKMVYNDAIENFDETLKLTLEYQELAEERGSEKAQGLRMNVGKALVGAGRPDEALEHILVSEKFYEKNSSGTSLANVYVVYGEYFEAKGKYDKALENYIKAYDLYSVDAKFSSYQIMTIEDIQKAHKLGKSDVDIDGYLNKYVELNLSADKNGDSGLASLFSTMEEINEKSYESKLLFREQEKVAIERSNEDREKLIIILTSAMFLLIIVMIKLKKEVAYRKKYERELQEIVDRDFLTKCYSRIYGVDKIESLIIERKEFSVALIDIDNFKKINDTYGHLVGDEALKMLGNILNNSFDGVGTSMRYGGEEFLIVLECSKEDGLKLLNDFRSCVEKSIFSENLTLTISGGLKSWTDESIEVLVDEADKLLYEAKHQGKNRICD
ncbi:tetratricopeptide repeat-containing diguanylate cyclase [uncultured Clostridium sp.]|jgi:diguanylate cyclase (GGDEF)-like protein|uniref:tetratricopeptide repeat-containing diguanylate cyclase n=1 Tax=uncultured Clostridium sp. TaxID=59620 RepID=UPI0026160268|nr:tetratricopeptide repeat-containing diguanylate cyclase [uncultured Clostridium sp.]